MDQDYNQLIKASMDFKQKKEEKYKEASASRLSKIAKKKVRIIWLCISGLYWASH